MVTQKEGSHFLSLSLCKIIAMHIVECYLKIALKLKIDRSLHDTR